MKVDDDEFREEEKQKITPKIVTSSTIPVHSVFIFLLTAVLTALVVELLSPNCTYWNWATNEFVLPESVPTYAIYGKSPNEQHLLHVAKVLQRLGYKRVALENEWDLLWAHDYPFFKMTKRLKDLTNQQIVNHVPGCGFITNKVDLSTTELTFLPKAFRLPSQREDFLNYAQRNPNALFVEKHNEHRNILIRPVKDINLKSNDTFVQEFIQKPYLVDGYKFDIGVYVIVTGIDPLRLYIYTGDVLFRYCSVKYYPFNASNIDSYVVGDDYLPTWQVPSLVKYYEHLEGNMRDSFDAYVRDQNSDPLIIWLQVEGIIRETVLAKEQQIAHILRSYKNLKFFELMRFDLIIDEDLRVYLMEANMSPNLSSAHFKPNALLYEQILYSAFSLVGVSSPVRGTLSERSHDVQEMITSAKNVATNLNACTKNDCNRFCNNDYCNLCLSCVTGSEYEILKRTHREHLHRASMKRVFPKPILNPENFDIEAEVQNMTKRNAWLTRWFYYKCLYDNSWCY
uniref:Uncharacterized protein n=1 Tax=Glossina pallidipes TaxID=7398 RepID=A0A1A9ZK50_GLOPL